MLFLCRSFHSVRMLPLPRLRGDCYEGEQSCKDEQKKAMIAHADAADVADAADDDGDGDNNNSDDDDDDGAYHVGDVGGVGADDDHHHYDGEGCDSQHNWSSCR